MKIFLLLLILLSACSNSLAFEGSYNLTEHYASNGTLVALPKGNFTLNVAKEEAQDNVYRFSFKVGNIITAKAFLNSSSAANFSYIASTRMMPPRDIFQLEVDMTAILEEADTVKLTNNSDSSSKLVIAGDAGSLWFKKSDDTATATSTIQSTGVGDRKERRERKRQRKRRQRKRLRRRAKKEGANAAPENGE